MILLLLRWGDFEHHPHWNHHERRAGFQHYHREVIRNYPRRLLPQCIYS